MNFSYGIIIVVGILAAISLGFIAADPSDVIEPRVIPVKEKPTMCTLEYAPVCGIDGKTYGNMCTLEASGVEFVHKGECGVVDPVVKPRVEPEVLEPEPSMTVPVPPSASTVVIAEGSGTPGCENTSQCYLPSSITIFKGDTVIWENPDSAAHTVTSGTPSDGHDGLFDSSLFMSGSTFEFTFEDAGTYDYFCMVHPWMAGQITVKEAKEMVVEESEPEPITVNSHILPKTALVGDTLIVEVEFRDDDNQIVDHVNYDITATQDGELILSEPKSHRHPGMHPIHETSVLGESEVEIKVVLQGLGHGEDITEPIGVETVMSVVPEMPEVTEPEPSPESLPMSLIISVPEGSGSPGCEETNECYVPYEVTIAVGGTVTWSNDDSAAHTVTSGNVNAGPTGVFDSGLFMSGSTYDFAFEDAGTYDYFCMVHPWMTGIINARLQ